MVKKYFLLLIAVASGCATGNELPSCHGKDYCEVFQMIPEQFTGQANVSQPHGGRYVYSDVIPTESVKKPAMMLGKPNATQIQWFSPDEEAALLQLKDKEVAQMAKKKTQNDRLLYLRKVGNYNWPKIILQNDQLCVPELAASESRDWAKHLICTHVELENKESTRR